ncbi:MAG: hypothetical protein P8X91_08255, partial [Candidatus Bathyarchaeota archaeon]
GVETLSFLIRDINKINGGEKLKKKNQLIVLTLATILFSISYFGAAFAKPSTPVSGTIEFISVVPAKPPLVAGESDNRIILMNIIEEWSGEITGIATAKATWIVHNAPLITNPDTGSNAHAIITFEDATVLSETGGLTIKLQVAGNDCHWTIIEGTGDLANVHGQGTASTATEPFTYTGNVHFDP